MKKNFEQPLMIKRFFLIPLMILAFAGMNAQNPSLVKDINTVGTSSAPANVVKVGSLIFYTATVSAYGNELFVSNGTSAGTSMVKDIYSGAAGSNPANLTNVNGILFFTANDGANGVELWISNGTAFGTIMVSDINAGSTGSSPSSFLAIGPTLYFSANDGLNGAELWKSDGTLSGTGLVADIGVYPVPTVSGSPTNMADVGGGLFYFQASNGAGLGSNGTELWASDGTSGGTYMICDVNPGLPVSNPDNITYEGTPGRAYFSATVGGVSGTELWKTDGTSGGTAMVRDINSSSGSSNPSNLVYVAGKGMFFRANDGMGIKLWISDGTSSGTILLNNNATGGTTFYITKFNDSIYYAATDGAGAELWKSNGTTNGTVRLKDINPTGSSSPTSLINIGGVLYFSATDGVNGTELWKSDGTSAGTVMLKDIRSGSSGSSPAALTDVGGTLYFTADDGVFGRELWRSDGTVPGTIVVKDLTSGYSLPASISGTVRIGSTIYFSADDGFNGAELWKSDGTQGGTQMVKDINPGSSGSSPALLTNVGGRLFFSASNGTVVGQNGVELWTSDGTSNGTIMLKDISSGSTSSTPSSITDVNGTAFFAANDGGALYGIELWKSDGTTAGTVLVSNIRSSTASSSPASFLAKGDTLFFSAIGTNAINIELWKSNGTSLGTVLVRNINLDANQGSTPTNLTRMGDFIYFQAYDGAAGSNGFELWRSDGTSLGTALVKNISPGSGSSSPANLVNINGTLFFSADDGAGLELYRSDGTSNGTFMVREINTFGYSSTPGSFINANGTLFFTADNGINGAELWKSDGTSAGTVLVNDVRLGSSGSSITSITDMSGGSVCFTATDGTNGVELWVSDGNSLGTVLVKDLYSGFLGSSPSSLILMGGSLYFAADDGVLGSELRRFVLVSISTSTLSPLAFCPGTTVSVTYSLTTGTVDPGNKFIAQLSNAAGSFASPVTIGNVTSTGSGSINCTLPSNAVSGAGYRIRVTSDNPAPISNSSNNGNDITVYALPTITITSSGSVCAGGMAVLSGFGTDNYQWIGGPAVSTYSIMPSITTSYSVVGTSTVTGCSKNASATVFVNRLPTVSISGANSICMGTSTALTGKGANTYVWTAGPSVSVYTITPSANTGYTVTGTSTVTGCSNSSSSYVVLMSLPTASISEPSSICSGVAGILSANVATSYWWSVGTTSQVLSVSTSGTYSVTITNNFGCSSTDFTDIVLSAPLEVSLANDTITCSGTSVSLNASGGQTYAWFPYINLNAQTGSSVVFTSTAPGSYDYTLTASNSGSCNIIDKITVLVNPLPVLSGVANVTTCTGYPVAISASGAQSYSWSPTTGVSQTNENAVLVLSTSGYVTYTLTGTDANLCRSTAIITVKALASPEIVASTDATITLGSPTAISASGAATYIWSPAEGLSATDGQIVFSSPSVTTTYIVTGAGENGCTSSAMITITILTTGINGGEIMYSISVYPNPTEGNTTLRFNVSTSGHFNIKVSNVMGQVVYSEEKDALPGEYKTGIDLSGKPKGIYLVNVSTGSGWASIPIIVE